jgi:uncharacterized delta-60 repeat protein
MKNRKTLLHLWLQILCLAALMEQQGAAKAPGSGGTCPAITPLNPPITSPTSPACANSGCPDTSFNGTGFVLTNTDGSVPKQSDMDMAAAVQQVTLTDQTTRLVAIGTTTRTSPAVAQGVALVRYNGDGSLDTVFGSGGVVKVFAPSGLSQAVDGILDPQGRILVLAALNSGGDFLVMRFLPDGALDTNFGSSGYSAIVNMKPLAILLDPAANILVAGSELVSSGKGKSTVEGAVFRLSPNGALDTSFGTGGQVLFSTISSISALAIQTVNSIPYILAAGGAQIVRLSLAGAVDSTFAGGTGIATTSLCGFGYAIYVLRVDSSGNILSAGSGAVTSGGPVKVAVVRFSPGGTVDATFGMPSSSGTGKIGFTLLDFFGSTNTPDSLEMLSDGSSGFAVRGRAEITAGSTVSHYEFVAKYSLAGTLATSFGNSYGAVALDWGSANNYTVGLGDHGLLIEPGDGKFVVASGSGFSSGPNTGYNFAVTRLWP